MFNNDLTKNFNHQDATLEILLMLLGAFLFGLLFCWVLKKIFSNNTSTSETEVTNKAIEPQIAAPFPQKISSAPEPATLEEQSKSGYNTVRIDDLTKISGVDLDMQNILKNQGVHTYIDLKDIDTEKLKEIVADNSNKSTGLREIETWPHQASLAEKGEWTRLYDYQSFVQRARTTSNKKDKSRPKNADDLKKIEGIGPKIEEVLNKNGIFTFKQLREEESDTLKRFIVIEDVRFEKNDTDTWPHQAGMAEKGQWEELSIYQEFMDYDNDEIVIEELDIPTEGKKQADSPSLYLASTDEDREEGIISSDADIETNKDDIISINRDYIKLLQDDDTVNKIATDDLKKIEGIGPKIEELLNKNNIHTYRVLHATDRNTLKKHLDNAGSQFKMHEPASWPHQAGMAARGEWNDLRIYQEFMDSGRETPSVSYKQNISSLPVNTYQEDDLKKIEGIGPKIEALLKGSGINTFEELHVSNRDHIKSILDKAGPQYRMHDPETWPLQAGMAHKQEWDKLKEYQDFLLGGRE